jgi:hypothetical protein
MKSHVTNRFWKCFYGLSPAIQDIAEKQYRLWHDNPRHPSLHFKRISSSRYWSARITDDYRCLGILEGDTVVWFWIGHHAEYERLI